jgi:hypothetical protein
VEGLAKKRYITVQCKKPCRGYTREVLLTGRTEARIVNVTKPEAIIRKQFGFAYCTTPGRGFHIRKGFVHLERQGTPVLPNLEALSFITV